MESEHKYTEIGKIIISEAEKKIEEGRIIKQKGENLIALGYKVGGNRSIVEKIEREGEREIIIGKQIINEGLMMKEDGEERIRFGKMLDKR
ncbi:MAG: hypothetical protein R6X10_10905 [Desulfobacterales bacterium]